MRGPLDLGALLRSRVVDVPDFPKPGVVFKDISPLLADHIAFAGAIDAIVAHTRGRDDSGTVDKVVGIEARGFIVAAPVAYRFGAGFVPVRKPGKLPLATHEEAYELEYGTNVLQVHQAEGDLKTLKSMEQAKRAGELLADRAKAAGVESVVFDRGGYRYHGRVKALADGAREKGLTF